MLSRRSFVVRFTKLSALTLSAAVMSLVGCEDPEVGSAPKMTKSKNDLLKELDAPAASGKRGKNKKSAD